MRHLARFVGGLAADNWSKFQWRLIRFFTSRPEMISAKDNLVSGAIVADPPVASTGVLDKGGWLVATLFGCRLTTFRFF
jgi:hypothetical protein